MQASQREPPGVVRLQEYSEHCGFFGCCWSCEGSRAEPSACSCSLAAPKFAPTLVNVLGEIPNRSDGPRNGTSKGRSNTGAWIGRWTDEIVSGVEQRIASVTATRADMGEDMQVRTLD